MNEEKFNLLDEKWIRVLKFDSTIEMVSITELFENAHLYQDLAGEAKVQDMAMLRFLLAILHTVISRYELDGEYTQIERGSKALSRWKSYWNNKKFNSKIFKDYLDVYRDRFWLMHPKYPFWQTQAAKKGTKYSASKLLCELSESGNKVRLFQSVSLEEKVAISFDTAARGLIFLNSYDDKSGKKSAEAKKKEKKFPTYLVAWLGQIGQIYASGENLFETLMLNCVLLQDGKECWPEDEPRWESKEEPSAERTEIYGPNNLAALYSLSSRRLFLTEEEGKVNGVYLLGGDSFNPINYFVEQNTLWKETENKKQNTLYFSPKRIPQNRQLWREFANVFMITNSSQSTIHQPGIVLWIQQLRQRNILEKNKSIEFITASVYYDNPHSSSIIDITGDSLTLHTSLLEDFNITWRNKIAHEVEICTELANASGYLAKNIARACVGENDVILSSSFEKGVELTYLLLNEPFKCWLESLNPQIKDYDSFSLEWHIEARSIARNIEKELSKDIPVEGYVGRKVIYKNKGKKSSKEEIMSVPIAQRIYRSKVKDLYPGKEERHA
jgi:CRISPR system Cascade subunit CasA